MTTASEGVFERWLKMVFRPDDTRRELYPWIEPGTPQELVACCLHLFADPWRHLKAFDRSAIHDGLNFIVGIDGGYLALSVHAVVPKEARKELIGSQFSLFTKFFAFDPFDDVAFMWWERLIGAEWHGPPSIQDDPEVCDWILDVILDLLEVPVEHIQVSALHGVNEFGANRSLSFCTRLAEEFLQSGKAVSQKVVDYALAVARGEAP
jgi:hypothetical protein